MATLRSNVLLSTAAMVVVGLIRPGFNIVVKQTFGPEVNGVAAALIAVIFLAALPATAALPTVMVRHVSLSLGAGALDEAKSHARMAAFTTLVLTGLAGVFALMYGEWLAKPPFSTTEAVWVALGLVAYTYWRLFRTLLLAIGEAALSFKAELASLVLMAITLVAVVLMGRADWLLAAFVMAYLGFIPLTVTRVIPYLARTPKERTAGAEGSEPSESSGSAGAGNGEARREFIRYNLYWFVATAASLGVREIPVLIFKSRGELAWAGEISVALSLLNVLAFAPRVIELPLVHEFSALAGRKDEARQKRLADRALHWMIVFTFAVGCGAAILAPPILSIAGDVQSEEVHQFFAIVALAFMLEMMLTPAANLMVASSHPAVFAINGASSLVAAFVWWYSPYGQSVVGVALGLALSYVVRSAGIAGYSKVRFGIRLFHQPSRKMLAFALGFAAVAASVYGILSSWVAFALFELGMVVIFWTTIREVWSSLGVGRVRRA